MITAKDARYMSENGNDNIEDKSIWFKLRLWWICGIFNKRIEKAASMGQKSIDLETYYKDTNFKFKYYPFIKLYYRKLGFYVGFENKWARYPVISWRYPIINDGNK